MATGTFATVIDCIDGRAQRPVANWAHLNLHVNYVDVVTEPGPDKALTQGTPAQLAAIKAKVAVSINAHHSSVIILAAHHDCAGNPISEAEHKQQIAQGTQHIASWGLGVRVIGLWVNSEWGIELVSDTGAQGFVPVDYAVALSCVDGRAQDPLTVWLKQRYTVHHVDLITEPEPDSALIHGTPATLDAVQQRLRYAIDSHQPRLLAVAAHHDCGGNTLSAAVHHDQVRRAANLLATWGLNLPIIGVWIDEHWQAHMVCEVPARSVV